MILFPSAKINLGLNVKFKRNDGFHEVETCMMSIPIYDILEIVPNSKTELTISGMTIDGDIEDNLIIKSFRLLQTEFNLPETSFFLKKQIPMGAGLGGGSADATFTLKGLNTVYKLNLTNDQIAQFASRLGSDCAFFAYDSPKIATGKGERLSDCAVDLSGYFLKLINPGVHISTQEAYANVVLSESSDSIVDVLANPIDSWKESLQNSFELSVFTAHPELKLIKEDLYKQGAVYAAMSGSGSSFFGLFKQEPAVSEDYDFEIVVKL